MNDVVKLKEIPIPIPYKGRERFISGWNTAAVAKWLVSKKTRDGFIGLSAVATTAYGRDSASNRQAVKRNINSLRRHMANTSEFLLVKYGYHRRIEAIKACNFADDTDRQIAEEQLASLVARGEVTLTEAERWRKMLFLPT
jgi:lysozyme family protein